MGEKYLIDTSAAIKYLNNSLPASATKFLDKELDKESNISFITKLELLVWETDDEDNMLTLQNFITNSVIIPVNDSLTEYAIKIRKAAKIKLPDVLIAATALVYGFTLIADNDKDFNKVTALNIGFKYINANSLK